jgi:hypothetical protein
MYFLEMLMHQAVSYENQMEGRDHKMLGSNSGD